MREFSSLMNFFTFRLELYSFSVSLDEKILNVVRKHSKIKNKHNLTIAENMEKNNIKQIYNAKTNERKREHRNENEK